MKRMATTYQRLPISCAMILLLSKGYLRDFGTLMLLSLIPNFVAFTISYMYEMSPQAMTAASQIRYRCCQWVKAVRWSLLPSKMVALPPFGQVGQNQRSSTTQRCVHCLSRVTETCWKKNFRSWLKLWLRIFLSLIRTDWSGARLRSPGPGVQSSDPLPCVIKEPRTQLSLIRVCVKQLWLYSMKEHSFVRLSGIRRGGERKGWNFLLRFSVLLTKRLS